MDYYIACKRRSVVPDMWYKPGVWGLFKRDGLLYASFEGYCRENRAALLGESEEGVEDVLDILERLEGDLERDLPAWRHKAAKAGGQIEWLDKPVGDTSCVIDQYGRYYCVPDGSHDWVVRHMWRCEFPDAEPDYYDDAAAVLRIVIVRPEGNVVSFGNIPNDLQINAARSLACASSGRFRNQLLSWLFFVTQDTDNEADTW